MQMAAEPYQSGPNEPGPHDPAHHDLARRRPGPLDLAAGLLLVATVVLHVVAMFPTYFAGQGSLTSQSDEAALYALLAASWAFALAVGLTGPHRTPIAAGLAAGIAVAELGFRGADLGDAAKYGSGSVGAGLWLMEAAWVVGALGAVAAVLAARSRHGARAAAEPGPALDIPSDASADQDPYAQNPYVEPALPQQPAPAQAVESPFGPTATADLTASIPAPDPTSSFQAGPGTQQTPAGASASIARDRSEDDHERLAWTMLVLILSLVVAGAFLPAWDHGSAVSALTGQSVSRNLGTGWDAPWQQVVGTFGAAAALVIVPVVAIRMRHKAAGAAAVVGALLVLTTQLVSAVVQVGLPVPPAELGLSPSQVSQLDLVLQMRLTGWFTIDALAAYALFATVMVWSNLRVVQEKSLGARPAPEVRSDAIPRVS